MCWSSYNTLFFCQSFSALYFIYARMRFFFYFFFFTPMYFELLFTILAVDKILQVLEESTILFLLVLLRNSYPVGTKVRSHVCSSNNAWTPNVLVVCLLHLMFKKKKLNICCKWVFLTKKWAFAIVGCDTLGERFSKFAENNLCS